MATIGEKEESLAKGFANRITTVPKPFDVERGLHAASLVSIPDETLKDLVKGAAGNSAYISSLVEWEANWLNEAFLSTPEASFETILGAPKSETIEDLFRELRILKRRAALLIGLADVGGVWTLAEVTNALSRFADFVVGAALRLVLRLEFEAGRIGPCTEADLETSCGMVVIGMGKLGAHELNYSSDIDLIVLFDETRFDPDDYMDVRKAFVRVTQQIVRLLSENTTDGYVFRTDLRLRPNPSVTPVCIAMEPAEHYYESVGRTWERAAMIKARPIAGDIAAGTSFLKRLKPFVWRKYLDFTAIKNAQDMLLNIRNHKNLYGEDQFEGRDIKLGQGGIREIEFFAQTHQLIFGGRDENLRTIGTLGTLRQLTSREIITTDTEKRLSESYVWLREIEHRIQMLDDRQTHQIPTSEQQLNQLAYLSGFEGVEALKLKLLETVGLVHEHTELSQSEDTEIPTIARDQETENTLAEFEERWFELPALRNEKSRELYMEVRTSLQSKIADFSDKHKVMTRFEQFLTGLPAGVQLFSLFSARPKLLDLVLDVCAVSPRLADFLGRQSGVLDAVLDRNFFERFADLDELKRELSGKLSEQGDYEEKLNALRRWQKELHFRNGVHLLRQISSPQEAALVYSNIAEASISSLLPHVQKHLEEKYGPTPGNGLCVLAMGKLGSQEMTATSDLDVIVIYDADGVMETEGPRQIATATYFARLTQALVSGLTAQTTEGNLYEVDLRLRPSGRKGPVATSLKGFSEYQKNDAWTWEHLALVRARVVAGPDKLSSAVQDIVDDVLALERDENSVLEDVRDMRSRLERAFEEKDEVVWQTKRGGGRLLDIELLLQTGAVLKKIKSVRTARELIPHLCKAGWFSDEETKAIGETHELLSNIQQIGRLIGPSFSPSSADIRVQSLLCNCTGENSVDEIEEKLLAMIDKSHHIVRKLLSSDQRS